MHPVYEENICIYSSKPLWSQSPIASPSPCSADELRPAHFRKFNFYLWDIFGNLLTIFVDPPPPRALFVRSSYVTVFYFVFSLHCEFWYILCSECFELLLYSSSVSAFIYTCCCEYSRDFIKCFAKVVFGLPVCPSWSASVQSQYWKRSENFDS